MSLLELDGDQERDRKELALTDLLKEAETPSTAKPAIILPPLPPRIGKLEKSKVLERAAAFLPQLASANRQLSTLAPEEVNIEALTGNEKRVIEMKLGLGVFEETSDKKDTEILPQHIISLSPSCNQNAQNDSDRFDAFVQQLLTFNGSEDDEPIELFSASTDENESENELLEFE
jgi:hypothetical protein